jgi:hypothetical protein
MNPTMDKSEASIKPAIRQSKKVEDPSNNSSSESYSTKSGTERTKEEEEEHQKQLAHQETKAVLCLRLAVVLVLVTSIIGVAVVVNWYTKDGEQTKFEDQFDHDAAKVLESVGSTLDKTMGALDSLAVTLMSDAHLLNQTWPFVTIPNFGVRGSKILPLSKAFYIQVEPLVTPENRKKWEEYALENQYWVDETMKIQESWKNYYGPVVYNWTAAEKVFSHFGDLSYDLT